MKKAVVCFAFAVLAAFSWGDTITNTVVIVSNYYNNVYHESVVTQKVKSTHVEYYFTNNVYTVSNTTLVVSQTNMNVTVVNTNFGPWIAKCEAAANNASNALSSARSAASSSAVSATESGSSASAAAASAAQAAASAASASSAASDGLSRINQRIQWFDDHAGETITNVNISTNIYYAEDSTARNGVSNNIASISALSGSVTSLAGRVSTLESDSYAQDQSYGGTYVYVVKCGTYATVRITIDTVNDGVLMSGGDFMEYWNSSAGCDRPCRLEYISGSLPRYVYIRHYFRGTYSGKFEVKFGGGSTYQMVRTTDTTSSSLILPTTFSGSASYLESVTYAKKKMSIWTQEKLDAMTAWVNGLIGTVNSRCSAIEVNFNQYNARMGSITNRIAILEAFHGVTPGGGSSSESPAAYVYSVTRNGSAFGTMTVNVLNPTRVATEWTDTYFYEYAVSTSWTGSGTAESPSIDICRKGFAKSGYSFDPWTYLVFNDSTDYQIQSRNTGPDEHSYFTGSETEDIGTYTYVFTLDHIDFQ